MQLYKLHSTNILAEWTSPILPVPIRSAPIGPVLLDQSHFDQSRFGSVSIRPVFTSFVKKRLNGGRKLMNFRQKSAFMFKNWSVILKNWFLVICNRSKFDSFWWKIVWFRMKFDQFRSKMGISDRKLINFGRKWIFLTGNWQSRSKMGISDRKSINLCRKWVFLSL